MTEFDNIYELLESVRLYRLRTKECLIPVDSATGQMIGYTTADSDFPSVVWNIPVKLAKETALARGTKEAGYIRDLLSSYMGRKQLLEELRKGTLEYGFARSMPVLQVEPESEPEPVAGPVQCFIPGL